MNANQFAVYQVKMGAEFRHLRFRPYAELQREHLQVDVCNYDQVYLSQMAPKDTAEIICRRYSSNIPKSFRGHAVSISDVVVLNRAGVVSAFYVDKGGLILLPGFLRLDSSGTMVSMETVNCQIDGKPGTWLACDEIIIDGRQFFLMQNEQMGNRAACVVVDGSGKAVCDADQFDEGTVQKLQEFLHPPKPIQTEQGSKPPLENWQKSFENGEYLRAAEMTEEQNYSFIDGRINNQPPKKVAAGKRPSVLKRLHEKQAEIARRSGKPEPHTVREQEVERNRK